MKAISKKLLATTVIVSMFSTAAFSNETLTRLVSNAQDNIITSQQFSESVSKSMANGEITTEDLDSYIKENSSPKAYKNIHAAIERKDLSELSSALVSTEGANWKGALCTNRFVGASVMALGIVGAIALVYGNLGFDKPTDEDHAVLTNLKVDRDNVQSELDSLVALGVPSNDYMIVSRQKEIENYNRGIANQESVIRSLEKSQATGGDIEKGAYVALGVSAAGFITANFTCK
jgi:hypothetical protein